MTESNVGPNVTFTMVVRLPVKMPDNSDFITTTAILYESDLLRLKEKGKDLRSEIIPASLLILANAASNFLKNKFDFSTFRDLAGLQYYQGTLSCRAWLAVSGKWANAEEYPAPFGDIKFELPATLIGPERLAVFENCIIGCLQNLSDNLINNFDLILKIINSETWPLK